MRLFIAIEIDPAAAAAVDAVAREVALRADAVVPRPRVTWVKPTQVHLTVRFIGEVSEARASAVAETLAPPLAMKAFELTLCSVGTFPPKGHPRVVWIGVTEGANQVIEVEQQVSARLEHAGVPREERPFHPHLTIGRVKEPGGLRKLSLANIAATPIARVGVTGVTLFESQPRSTGAHYRPIALSIFG